MDIPFQRKGGPYTIEKHEEPLSVRYCVMEGKQPVETFTHRMQPGYDEEERSFSYVAALDYVAEQLVEKSKDKIDVRAYQREYYAPEKQGLSVWLKVTPEELAKQTGQKLAEPKELEDIFADRGMPVRLDKKYMEESKFHLSADLLCDRKSAFQNTLEPKEKLLKDMEITTAKGLARGE